MDVSSDGLDHITKMAAMSIYMVKSFKSHLHRNQTADDLRPWYAAFGTQVLPNLFK